MKYAILNTIDRPEKRLVVEIIGNKAYYMSRGYLPSMKQYDGMTVRPMTTDLTDFGFKITEREYQVDFTLSLDHVSTAKYEDGKQRKWQGQSEFSLPKVMLEESE